jgi:hypothetical protein
LVTLRFEGKKTIGYWGSCAGLPVIHHDSTGIFHDRTVMKIDKDVMPETSPADHQAFKQTFGTSRSLTNQDSSQLDHVCQPCALGKNRRKRLKKDRIAQTGS